MGYGLQTFDEDRNVILDMSTMTSKILGRVTVGEEDGTLTDKRLLDGNVWTMIEKVNIYGRDLYYNQGGLKITSSDSKLSWEHVPKVPKVLCRSGFVFVYGIY